MVSMSYTHCVEPTPSGHPETKRTQRYCLVRYLPGVSPVIDVAMLPEFKPFESKEDAEACLACMARDEHDPHLYMVVAIDEIPREAVIG